MAQLDLLVGDISGNVDKVVTAAEQAVTDGADIIAFPELTLTGYPPEDLLFRNSMWLRVSRALEQIRARKLDIVMVIGHPLKEQGVLYNALTVLQSDTVLAVYRKQRLPNYEVFDEQRYFSPGFSPCVVTVSGVPVGMTICEDLWDAVPAAQASQAGARLLININASPYHHGKGAERLALLQERARQGDMPLVYVNLVGGQDELVFDGRSLAISADGERHVQAPGFVESLFAVEFDVAADGRLALCADQTTPPAEPLEAVCYQALVMGLRDYVNKNRFPGVVLGLSGGIDSALTLAIAVDALGPERVEAVMMPFEYTSSLSVELAQAQATRLGVSYKVIPISSCYASFTEALAEEFAGFSVDVTEQNLQARCRGVLLMAISNKKGSMVITTGNKSEIAVGYSTLYGDMAGGFNVLKDVYKTLVYRLARYRNTVAASAGEADVIPAGVIARAPSAELAPGQKDEDSLPPYDRLDAILALYIENDLSADAIMQEGFAADEVHRVLRLVDRNEYKRRQGPVGVRLTRKGFGRDRRYPITNGWQPGE